MSNDDATFSVAVKYLNTSENNETIGNKSDSVDLRANNSANLGETGNASGVRPKPKESKKFLVSRNAPTYGLEQAECTKNAMIIFNQENFVSPFRKRVGSDKDVNALKETFERFKFKVFTCEDYKKEDLIETVRVFVCGRDYASYGCVCVALLTHGQEGTLEASDRSFPDSDFFECFDVRKSKNLAGKPIIIIVQACRGKQFAEAVEVEVKLPMNEDLDDQDPRFIYLPTSANMIIFHSCFTNTGSGRVRTTGSLFIQSLCHQIKLNPELDFESICLQVKRKVAVTFKKYEKSQMPVVTSTLIRKLYFQHAGLEEELPGDKDPLGMPPKYFLQYFKYIKKCFRWYIQGQEDCLSKVVPEMLLEDVEKNENATSDKQLTVIKEVYEYLKKIRLEDKSDKYTEFDFLYYHYLLTE